jgi:hypothetical protein
MSNELCPVQQLPPLRVLTLGEGNFSFSLALVKLHNPSRRTKKRQESAHINYPRIDLIASSYDSKVELYKKFPESIAIVEQLLEKKVRVLHDVDATNIEATLSQALRHTHSNSVDQDNSSGSLSFDWIIFNNPHCGVEDVNLHQSLLIHFFHSVSPLLNKTGKIQLILANDQPASWKLFAAAKQLGFLCTEQLLFNDKMYEGYEAKRHHSARVFSSKCNFLQQFQFMRKNEISDEELIISEYKSLYEEENNEQLVQCNLCDKAYKSHRGFEQHYRDMHTDFLAKNADRLLLSSDSNKLNNTEEKLERSNSGSVHSNSSEITPSAASLDPSTLSHPCSICSLRFSTPEALSSHLLGIKPLDSNDRTHLCELCQRGFPNQRALAQHKQRMEGRIDHVPVDFATISRPISTKANPIQPTIDPASLQKKTRRKILRNMGILVDNTNTVQENHSKTDENEGTEGDLFDCVLGLESAAVEEGRNRGLEYGREQGLVEGRKLGLQRGGDLAKELSFYHSYATTTLFLLPLTLTNPALNRARITQNLAAVVQLIDKFQFKAEDEGLDDQLGLIRAKFRLAIQLQNVATYFKTQEQLAGNNNAEVSKQLTAAQIERSF